MPLVKGKSQKSFVKNLKTELEHGKPQKQALAIAYSMKRKAQRKKMADGGQAQSGTESAQESMRKAFHFADGGSPAIPVLSASQAPPIKPIASNIRPLRAHGGEMEEDHCPHCGQGYADGGETEDERMARIKHTNYSYSGQSSDSDSPKKPQPLGQSLAASFEKKKQGYSKGGFIKDNYQPEHEKTHPDLNFHSNEFDSGYLQHRDNVIEDNDAAEHEDNKKLGQHGMHEQGPVPAPHEDEYGLVDKIMAQRSKDFSGEARLSHGGQVANAEHGMNDEDLAGFAPNEFDDLVLRDDLESHYGDDDNSGDALGNAGEDERRRDIVARIMASRRKKDRLPNPA